eukprot:gene1332-1678_t
MEVVQIGSNGTSSNSSTISSISVVNSAATASSSSTASVFDLNYNIDEKKYIIQNYINNYTNNNNNNIHSNNSTTSGTSSIISASGKNNFDDSIYALKRINLSNKKIYCLDQTIRSVIRDEHNNDFKKITVLQIDNNLLGEIPEILQQLTNLDTLSMSRNHILDIPDWIPTHLIRLRRLDLSHNSISMVPESFHQLNLLDTLNLSHNLIVSVPSQHFPPNLITLDLSFNQIQTIELPSWFESLISLDLSSNKLRNLGNLPFHLAMVSIDDNHLDSIDHQVILRNKELTLKFNQSFNDIVLERIYHCWYTRDPVLDLSGLGMSVVPPVLGMLSHLTDLDLSGNCLSVLPNELENLTNLVRLDLSFNILTTLPLYLINFKQLSKKEGYLGLQGTLDTLVNPPKRIAEGGVQEIQRYFQDLFMGDPSYRVKIMMVGQENVGKTSLVKCLKMKKKFAKGMDHLGSNVSTDGIDIDEIKFSLDHDPLPPSSQQQTYHSFHQSPNNSSSNGKDSSIIMSPQQKITMSVWDCAGQELYYTTHQMFLTDTALYIVVWDLCFPEINSRVEFWLHSIRSKAESAPIILVGTHLDDFLSTHTEQELDEILSNIYNKYFRRFKLKGICVVSCLTGSGFDKFQDLLKRTVSELPSLKQPIPELYVKLEKLIIKKRSTLSPPILTWQNYSQMVLSNLDFHDEIHVKVATKSLVSLGIVSFFDETHLDNYVFLDPQWLTNVFSSIITTKHKFIKDGVLKRGDLYQIWKPPMFLEDEGLHNLLINLLERFELMFPLDSSLVEVQSPPIQSPIPHRTPQQQQKILNTSGGTTTTTTTNISKSSEVLSANSASTLNNNSSFNNNTPNGTLKRSSVLVKKKSGPLTPEYYSQTLSSQSEPFNNANINSNGSNSSASFLMSPLMVAHPHSPTQSVSSHQLLPLPEISDHNTPTITIIDVNQKFIIPSQLPDKRPSFDLLWLPKDQSRIEYNRWFQLSFIPSGLFSRILIRLLISKEFDMKPILYWRNGVVLESTMGRSRLSTATALIELNPSSNTAIKISVRGDRRTGRGISAKLLRLIVEITDTLCTSWYHLECKHIVPCPHCTYKGKVNCTLFTLEECEKAASSGTWYLSCGNRKIALESFVPDVAMSDFWGSGSKKFDYEQITIEKENRYFSIKPGDSVNSICQVSVCPDKRQPLHQQIPQIEIPLSLNLTIVDNPNDVVPVTSEFDYKGQSLVITGKFLKASKEVEVESVVPKLIGRGASGKIYKGSLNGVAVAVKQLEVVGEDAPRIFSEFRKEIHVMSDLKHQNVVNLIGFTLHPFTMVMEYIDCGDLHKFLHSSAGDVLNDNWGLILKLAMDIARGMDFLHSVTPPLLHRDLKSPNILLSKKDGIYQAKVGDFGLSSRMFIQALRHKLRNFPVGNITWVAPEILKEEEYTVKSDVYAFGLIMHELLTRRHPYKEFNYSMVSLQEEAIKNGLRPTIPANLTQSVLGHDYCSLMRDCWDGDVHRRPTFSKICKRLRHMIKREDTNIILSSPEEVPLSNGNLSLSIGSNSRYTPLDESSGGALPSLNIVGNGGASALLEELPVGGQLQMSIRTQPESLVNCLVWENRRVWGGTEEGSIFVWNAENGKKILYESKLHNGPIQCMIMANDEDVWSFGGVGKGCTVRVWNAWRLNLDDQPRFKSDFINKKGRGNSTFGRKTWRQRWFVLDRKNKTLNYYCKQSDKAPKSTLPLEGANFESNAQNPNRVNITFAAPEKRTLEMEFKNESEKTQWMTSISRIVNQNTPLHEIEVGIDTNLSSNDHISSCIQVGQHIWVAFKRSPNIIIYHSKTRVPIDTITIADPLWKGTDKMILHHNFVWLCHSNLVCHIEIKNFHVLNVQSQHTQPILSIASIDNQVWISCNDSSISIWDGETGSILKRIETLSPISKILQYGSFVWAAAFGYIYIFDPVTATFKKQIECKQHANSIKDMIRVFQQTVWSCCGSNNILGVVKSQPSTTLFVNFQPFQDSTCQGTVSGVGYSFSVNNCLMFPNSNTSYEFIVDALRAGWKVYNHTYTEPKCAGEFSDGSYKNGSCVPDWGFDELVPVSPYSLMWISENAIFPSPNSIVTTYYPDKSCNTDDYIMYEYYTPNYKVRVNQVETETYNCINSIPYMNQCYRCGNGQCCNNIVIGIDIVMGIIEKIKDIEAEMARTQKNKATEHHLGMLKAKLARLRLQLLEPTGKSGKTGEGFEVLKSGDARVALIGFPSVGKSTILTKLTDTQSEQAAYEFTTLTCIPGVIQYHGARIQLLDTPGIIEGAAQGRGRGKQVIAVARTADLILMMLDANKGDVQKRLLEEELEAIGIRLNTQPPNIYFKQKAAGGVNFTATVPLTKITEKLAKSILHEYKIFNCDLVIRCDPTVDELIDAIEGRRSYIKCLYVYNKIDQLSIEEIDKIARKQHSVVISCNMSLNLDYLLDKIWEYLSLVRVYTKKRGEAPDFSDPVILRQGASVEHVCGYLHKELATQFKYGIVWGISAKHCPQRVGLAHNLDDEDVIQIVKK